MPRNKPGNRGFTLVELMIGTAILGVLGAIGVVTYQGYVATSKRNRAITDIRMIDLTIATYEGTEKEPPPSLAVIDMGGLVDPWGTPYRYQRFDLVSPGARRKDKNLVPINSTYDLWSNGPDKVTNTVLTAKASHDDIIRANDGGFIGLAADY